MHCAAPTYSWGCWVKIGKKESSEYGKQRRNGQSRFLKTCSFLNHQDKSTSPFASGGGLDAFHFFVFSTPFSYAKSAWGGGPAGKGDSKELEEEHTF